MYKGGAEFMDREKEINEILDFVERHKESMASQMVLAKILGDKSVKIDNKTIDELRNKLSRAREEDLESCYYIIK